MIRYFSLSHRALLVVSILAVAACVASGCFFQDPAKGVIKRQHAETYFSTERGVGRQGDTLALYPKRPLRDGSLVDYPPDQRFEVRITQGAPYAWFVFPGNKNSIDTSNVLQPLRVFYPFGAEVTVRWDAFALNVDTAGEYLMIPRGSAQMIREVSAPSRP